VVSFSAPQAPGSGGPVLDSLPYASSCQEGEHRYHTGPVSPAASVDADSDRMLVVWVGGYRPKSPDGRSEGPPGTVQADQLTLGGRLRQIGTGANLRLRLDPVGAPAPR